MTEHHSLGRPRTISNEADTESMGGCLTRVVWLIAAPLGLLVLGAMIARDGSGVLSMESLLYWSLVVAALVVRYLDIVRFKGQTLQGQPASRADFGRYLLRFPALALAGWSAAVVLGAA